MLATPHRGGATMPELFRAIKREGLVQARTGLRSRGCPLPIAARFARETGRGVARLVEQGVDVVLIDRGAGCRAVRGAIS